jgi:SEC-C motif-containing protein
MLEQCCGRFHSGEIPDDARLLMRSRYAAYKLALPDYIIETTHRSSPQRKGSLSKWRAEIVQFCKETNFQGLEVLEFIDGETQSWVTFRAKLMHGGKDNTFTEKSLFVREGERWYYKSGQFLK